MESLLSWQTALFVLSIHVATWCLRRLFQSLLPTLRRDTPPTRAQAIWENFLLPSFPVFIGLLFGLLKYPYPSVLTTVTSRILYGVVCGFFSGWGYQIVKALLSKKFDVQLDDDPTPKDVTLKVSKEEKKQ